jgi:glycosyltransferase involved in cell wall biosynthesis
MRTLFCNSAYGDGGVGQHFAHVVESSRAAGRLDRYYCFAPDDEDPKGRVVNKETFGLLQYTPLRFSPSWKDYIFNEIFDWRVARQISRSNDPVDTITGFAGKSLRTFRRALDAGASRVELLMANSHVDNVARLHARAAEDSGIRDTWLNTSQRRKTYREYELADRVYVHSEYVRRSLIEAGIPAEKLKRISLPVDDRFQPPPRRVTNEAFHMVYVGRVEVTKGIDILLQAFERVPIDNKRLTIVGGWSTSTVRRLVQNTQQRDSRIVLAPGDPLPVLQNADVFVHPSYEDGFGYAPTEALACGVPVIVTEDTGMKEHVTPGANGFIIPTGSVSAIVDCLMELRSHPLAATTSLLDSSPTSTKQRGGFSKTVSSR